MRQVTPACNMQQTQSSLPTTQPATHWSTEHHSPVDGHAPKLLVVAQQRWQVGGAVHQHQELIGIDESWVQRVGQVTGC